MKRAEIIHRSTTGRVGGWGGGTGMFVLPQNLQIQIMMMTDAADDD